MVFSEKSYGLMEIIMVYTNSLSICLSMFPYLGIIFVSLIELPEFYWSKFLKSINVNKKTRHTLLDWTV